MSKTIPLFFPLLLILALLNVRCANPVSPTGGPKDEKPPKILYSYPPLYTKHFDKKSVRFDFNEFIALKNPATEIFISPPFKKPPETHLRNKSLILDITDSLKPQTTYNISFGNAITDITEGNILKGFNYVFSTGDFIDSLSLGGVVLNALDLTPVKDVIVGLYIKTADTISIDSLPLKSPPFYITRTNENGKFIFNNLQAASGKLFAVSDQNGDLIFNQLSEKIAFLDSLVSPVYTGKQIPDTLKPADSVQSGDSIKPADSVPPADSVKKAVTSGMNYTLYMFEQPDTVQRLIKSGFAEKSKIQLIFRLPIENLSIRTLFRDSLVDWYLTEYSAKNDTATLWITRADFDSVTLVVHSENQSFDTISLSYIPSEKPKKKSGQDNREWLKLINPGQNFSLNHFKLPLELAFSFPLASADFTRFKLVDDKDTLNVKAHFSDSIHRRLIINYPWKEDRAYKLIIPDSALFSINGLTNDSLKISFRTKAEKDIGNLNVTVNLPDRGGNYLIQLLNEKENILYEQKTIKSHETVHFKYLAPLKYKLKAVLDRNGNGKWDAGNYYRGLQPEEVFYFSKPLEVRANWDLDETWN